MFRSRYLQCESRFPYPLPGTHGRDRFSGLFRYPVSHFRPGPEPSVFGSFFCQESYQFLPLLLIEDGLFSGIVSSFVDELINATIIVPMHDDAGPIFTESDRFGSFRHQYHFFRIGHEPDQMPIAFLDRVLAGPVSFSYFPV